MKKQYYFISDVGSRMLHTKEDHERLMKTGDFVLMSNSDLFCLIRAKKAKTPAEPQYHYGGRKAGFKRSAVAEYHGC